MSGKIVAGFGALIIGMGLTMAISPNTLVEFAESFISPRGLGVAAALRITLGVLLWAASDASRMPKTLKAFGVLFIVGGLAIPLIGVERMRSMVDWGIVQGEGWMRTNSLIAVAMGAYFVWATLTTKSASSLQGDV
jgi:hypothetical protein